MEHGKFYSWEIVSDDTAIKHTDLSVFKNRGTEIPIETREFWGANSMKYGDQPLELTIVYDGKEYNAKIEIDVYGRTRMFWTQELSDIFNSFEYIPGAFPLMRFKRIAIDRYSVSLEQDNSANPSDPRYKLYQDFQESFPLESLDKMPLEKYTNLNRNDSFCYWVESRTFSLGSIWGGSSYKFGIYKYEKKPNDTRITSDDEYAWYTWYKATDRHEAYKKTLNSVIAIAQAATNGDFDAIDKNKELGDAYKWKIAFLYSQMSIVPIYKREMLATISTALGLENAKKVSTPKIQEFLMSKQGNRDFYSYYDYLLSLLPKEEKAMAIKEGKTYWLFSPGENAKMWDEYYQEGVMGIGWDKLGDLRQFKSDDEIVSALEKEYGGGGSHKNDKCAITDFVTKMQVGDVIIVKQGRRKLLGKGEVTSDYYYDESKERYKSRRKVTWTHKGDWIVDHDLAMKTLTDISQYDGYPQKLEMFMGDESKEEKAYYWLNAKPALWSVDDCEIGDEQTYTAYNENGNKRMVFTCFESVKAGDLAICYASSPVSQTKAIIEFTQGLHKDEKDQEVISFSIKEWLPLGLSMKDLQHYDELSEMSVMKNNQGSLFSITEKEFNFVYTLTKGEEKTKEESGAEKYTDEDFLSEVFVSQTALSSMKRLLKRKKNIILQGAPGVGKTFCAKRLCYALMGEKDKNRVAFVQFHQNYSYEDFIMGYKPKEDSFELRPGIFYNFCKDAQKDLDRDYFFIIDEINRGNLSKVFGELLMLIERDYREESAYLVYTGEEFSVPSNVYLIGLMNTADRSLAMIDYALRRRFSFVEMTPCFESKSFKDYQESLASDRLNSLLEVIKDLNKAICKDDSLGKGFEIGHSYFCNLTKESCTDTLLKEIVKYDIIPTLQEYWFDDDKKVDEWTKALRAVFE